jgi:GPI ethanolamine phosphate transferase 3 subunit O
VKDLHSVDNGCMEHLLPEMAEPDWDVIVAHFLGVDHAGHRYGTNHPAMSAKLQQIDLALEKVMRAMQNDTILFVLSDHGEKNLFPLLLLF